MSVSREDKFLRSIAAIQKISLSTRKYGIDTLPQSRQIATDCLDAYNESAYSRLLDSRSSMKTCRSLVDFDVLRSM